MKIAGAVAVSSFRIGIHVNIGYSRQSILLDQEVCKLLPLWFDKLPVVGGLQGDVFNLASRGPALTRILEGVVAASTYSRDFIGSTATNHLLAIFIQVATGSGECVKIFLIIFCDSSLRLLELGALVGVMANLSTLEAGIGLIFISSLPGAPLLELSRIDLGWKDLFPAWLGAVIKFLLADGADKVLDGLVGNAGLINEAKVVLSQITNSSGNTVADDKLQGLVRSDVVLLGGNDLSDFSMAVLNEMIFTTERAGWTFSLSEKRKHGTWATSISHDEFLVGESFVFTFI
jgi:hypothetical protein